jgi:hypothetical protein
MIDTAGTVVDEEILFDKRELLLFDTIVAVVGLEFGTSLVIGN